PDRSTPFVHNYRKTIFRFFDCFHQALASEFVEDSWYLVSLLGDSRCFRRFPANVQLPLAPFLPCSNQWVNRSLCEMRGRLCAGVVVESQNRERLLRLQQRDTLDVSMSESKTSTLPFAS